MLFYRAVAADGRLHLCGTQAEAKAINKDFDEFDCPTDKAGLKEVLQDLLDRAQGAPAKVDTSDIPEAGPEFFEKAELKLPACPKCGLRPKAAQMVADMQIRDLFADELDKLPDRSILRAHEITTERVFEIARRAQAVVENSPDST